MPLMTMLGLQVCLGQVVVVWVRYLYHGYSLESDDCYTTGTNRPKQEGTRGYARVDDRRLIDECVSFSTALPALSHSLTIVVSLILTLSHSLRHLRSLSLSRYITVTLSLSSPLHRSTFSHPHPDPVSNAEALGFPNIFDVGTGSVYAVAASSSVARLRSLRSVYIAVVVIVVVVVTVIVVVFVR